MSRWAQEQIIGPAIQPEITREYPTDIYYNTQFPQDVEYKKLLDVWPISDKPLKDNMTILATNLYKITLPSITRCIIQLIYLLTLQRSHIGINLNKRCICTIMFVLVKVTHIKGHFSEEQTLRSFELGRFVETPEGSVSHNLKVIVRQSQDQPSNCTLNHTHLTSTQAFNKIVQVVKYIRDCLSTVYENNISMNEFINELNVFLSDLYNITGNTPLDTIRVELEKNCRLIKNKSIYFNMMKMTCSWVQKIRLQTQINIQKLEYLMNCKIIKTTLNENSKSNSPQTSHQSLNKYILYFARRFSGFRLVIMELEYNRISSKLFTELNLQSSLGSLLQTTIPYVSIHKRCNKLYSRIDVNAINHSQTSLIAKMEKLSLFGILLQIRIEDLLTGSLTFEEFRTQAIHYMSMIEKNRRMDDAQMKVQHEFVQQMQSFSEE